MKKRKLIKFLKKPEGIALIAGVVFFGFLATRVYSAENMASFQTESQISEEQASLFKTELADAIANPLKYKGVNKSDDLYHNWTLSVPSLGDVVVHTLKTSRATYWIHLPNAPQGFVDALQAKSLESAEVPALGVKRTTYMVTGEMFNDDLVNVVTTPKRTEVNIYSKEYLVATDNQYTGLVRALQDSQLLPNLPKTYRFASEKSVKDSCFNRATELFSVPVDEINELGREETDVLYKVKPASFVMSGKVTFEKKAPKDIKTMIKNDDQNKRYTLGYTCRLDAAGLAVIFSGNIFEFDGGQQ